MIRVLVADDQRLFAESLKYVLEGASRGSIEVIGIAENGRVAVQMTESHDPDVVLMDIRMPVMDGVKATSAIHQDFPRTKVLVLTTFNDDDLAVSALSSGATGYVLKDTAPQDLIRAIDAVANGAFYIAPTVGIKLIHLLSPEDAYGRSQKEVAIPAIIGTWNSLTRREAEIAYFAALALTNAEIGNQLFISAKTVKNHLRSIFSKLKIRSRLQLITAVAPVVHALHQ